MVTLPAPILRVLCSRPTKIIEDSEDEGEDSGSEDGIAPAAAERKTAGGIKAASNSRTISQARALDVDEDTEQVTLAVGSHVHDEADDDSSDDGVPGGVRVQARKPKGAKTVVPNMKNVVLFVVRQDPCTAESNVLQKREPSFPCHSSVVSVPVFQIPGPKRHALSPPMHVLAL